MAKKPSTPQQKAYWSAYYLANRDKMIASASEYQRANREKTNAKNRAWRAAHPEQVRALNIERCQRPEVKASKAAWKKRNPLAVTEHTNRRRKNVTGKVNAFELRALFDMQNNQCWDCGRADVKLTIGHAIPLSLGGAHSVENIIGQCQSCNSKQGTRPHPTYAGSSRPNKQAASWVANG